MLPGTLGSFLMASMSNASAFIHFLGTVRLKKSSSKSTQSLIRFWTEMSAVPIALRFWPLPGVGWPMTMWSSIFSFREKAYSFPARANRQPSGKASINSALFSSLTDSSRNIEGRSHVNFTVVCRLNESPVTYAPSTAWRTFSLAMRSS